ncbi:MAG: hypothetical protein EAX96_08315 [Candidatus Lokiarchaeota archaeon]|nr:hypothetical protein [Candidatus Lokiarchaeota archaeon]
MSEKLSARNRIKCKIEGINKTDLLGEIHLISEEEAIMTAVITRDALEKFNIKKDDDIKVISRPIVVMIENLD